MYPRWRAASSIAAAALNGPYCDRAETSNPIDFDRLVGGESVTFETERGPKGDRAVRVEAA